MGEAVRVFGVCPRNRTVACPGTCQSALNELGTYCTAEQPVNVPFAIMTNLGITCANTTGTCVLGTASFSTAGAMFTLSVPDLCTSPFAVPPAASAAPRWRAPALLGGMLAALAALL